MAKLDLQTIIVGVVIGLLGVYIVYQSYSNNNNKKQSRSAPATGLTEKEYQKYQLVKKINVSHNTRLFRFALQTPDTILGLPIGKHISFRCSDEKNEEVLRSYTPVTSDDEKGYFEMVIKIYPNGKMSQHLDHLKIGDYIEARGPLGSIHYDSIGHFNIKKKQNEYTPISVKKLV